MEATFGDSPTSLMPGDSALYLVQAYVTYPLSTVSLTVSESLGYSDVLHFGEINVKTGEAYECNNPERWTKKKVVSAEDISVQKISTTYTELLNTEGWIQYKFN